MRSGWEKVVVGLTSFLDEETPAEHDVFTDGEDSSLEKRSYAMREPVIKLTAAIGIRLLFNPVSDLRERDAAQEECLQGLLFDKGQNTPRWFRFDCFRNNICVQKISVHRSMSLTGAGVPAGSRSKSP